ncbi:MAG: 1,4-alpha-glucan branching enzyme, partial [Chromatiaceae bacterium]
MAAKLPYPLAMLQHGEAHDPFGILGRHPDGDKTLVRAFMPSAEEVELDGIGPMQRLPQTDIFEIRLDAPQTESLPRHYQLNWIEKADGRRHSVISPYSFDPLLSDLDLHLFSEGRHHHAYRLLGAHLMEVDGILGCRFAVWAPAVRRASVVGDFNGWNGLRHPMRNRGGSGVWELFIPGLHADDLYKFEFSSRTGQRILKADPYGRAMNLRPDTASRIAAPTAFEWQDQAWLEQRAQWQWMHRPMSIY